MLESTLKHAASCTICIILAFFFASIGLAKLVAPAAAQQAFARWGHPDWFHLFVGTLELIGAVLLINRRTATLAAAILAGVMLGAVATHLRSGDYARAILPSLLLIPIGAVGYCRRLDATWMRRATSRHRAQVTRDEAPPAISLPGTWPGWHARSDPSPRPRLRIGDAYHADVPGPLSRPADRSRRA